MPNINRVRIGWLGWAGAPGVTTFYTIADSVPNTTAIKAWMETLKNNIPSGSSLVLETTGQQVDSVTGKANGTWVGTNQTTTTSTGTGSYAAPCGAQINWSTGAFVDGKAMRGRTFLVPLIAANYQADGTLLDAFRTAVITNAETFRNAMGGTLMAWNRKTGTLAAIIKADCPDKAVVLRSRRQ